jgi:hypothetical protein
MRDSERGTSNSTPSQAIFYDNKLFAGDAVEFRGSDAIPFINFDHIPG